MPVSYTLCGIWVYTYVSSSITSSLFFFTFPEDVSLTHTHILVFQIECAFVERQLGWWRYGCLYIICGLSGNMFSSLFVPALLGVGPAGGSHPPPSPFTRLPSSILLGALFGMLPVQLLLLILRRTMKGLILFLLLVISSVSSLALGLLPFVDNFAFIGGLLAGLVASLLLVPLKRKPYSCCELMAVVPIRFLCFCILFVSWELSIWMLFDDGFRVHGWCDICTHLDCENFGMSWCNGAYV